MSFRLKTILGIALIEATLLAILIFSSLDYLRRSNEDEMDKRARTTARLFAATIKDAVLTNDLAAVESALAEVLTIPGVEYARVRGRRDLVLAESGKVAPAPNGDDAVLDVAQDIAVAGVAYGRVEIGLATGEIHEVLAAARRQAALIAGVEMALVALFSFALGSYLTRGLAHLRQASRHIAAGELEFRIPASGRDELAETARAFNDMSAQLQAAATERDRAVAELAAHRAQLEELVARRTKELSRSNDELRETNRKLADAHTQLQEQERMASLGQLAAGVAHEINNPIGFVTSNLGTLDAYLRQLLELAAACRGHDAALPDAERQRMAALRRKADLGFLETDGFALVEESRSGLARVKKIVADLRDFAHLGSREWQRVDLIRGLESTLDLVQGHLTQAEVVRDYDVLPEVECLPTEINQVFLNLLLNAAQAIAGRGTIALRAGTADGGAWIEVADSGCGIAPENLNRVFDPFFTTKPVGQGTGLGLSLSYGIVQRHHGRLNVASSPGQGATFRLWLPLRQPQVPATA